MTTLQPRHKALLFTGLTSAEVEASRQAHGANVLSPPERDPWWHLFLQKFDDPVIRILIIAAVVAVITGMVDGKYVEGVGIIVAILLATFLAFINEHRAAREFDILNQVNDEVPVKVIRDGDYKTVPKKDIVVGDIVLIELGEEIPCDGNVLDAVSLQVDEACLTGESVPVDKTATERADDETGEAVYPVNRVFRGTFVRDGHGTIEVSAVGDFTEIGNIAKPASEDTGEQTPLSLQLERLSGLIGVLGFLVAGFIYVALVVRGVISGELNLTGQQWFFSGILALGVVIGLARVWVPIVYDALELLGRDITPRQWLEKDGFVQWLKTLGIGAAFFAGFLGIGYVWGLIPDTPRHWLPAQAGEEFLTYFMISVTIIVVAVPEGLAMSVTLSLAYSMRKMTAANNLVRHMHACETIGAATVICSDKTGTLTLNEMRVHGAEFPCLNGVSDAFTSGDIGEKELLVAEAVSANSTANLSRAEGAGTGALGNPTECALLWWLDKRGVDYISYRNDFSVLHQWTFSTERKFMATMGVSAGDGDRVLHVKGAPEIVMDRCATVLTREEKVPMAARRLELEAALKDYQRRGMRTLGFAYKQTTGTEELSNIEDLADDLTWLGFVAIADPVRPDVPRAVQMCQDAGIAVKIVTGDNSETAVEIARQIGLLQEEGGGHRHITGRQFAELNDEDASCAASELKVMSRARPLDKLRLVKLLRDAGHVVAVTGDGTNDAPALNYADVGLSMGKTGTSIAKEASDIVLLDDSFNSIVSAVMWGRSLYENIQRFILFQLTINVAALGIALLGPFIGVKLPLTVTQMLWVNLIMDTFAALALATEPPHRSVMDRPPRNPKDFIVSKVMAKNILTVAAVFLVFLVWFLLHIQADGTVTEYELSVFFTVFVMLQCWNLFNARCLGQSHSAFRGILENKGFVVIASAIFVGQIFIVQFGGGLFRTVPLSLRDWVLIVLGTSVVLWSGEFSRLFKRLRLKQQPAV